MSAARFAAAVVALACMASAQEKLTAYRQYESVYRTSTRPIEAFARIVEDRPDDAWARHFHARAFIDGRDLRAARVAIDHAVRLDWEQPFHRRLLGDLEALRGDREAAAAAYRAAASLETRAEPSRFFAGLAAAQERASTDCRRAVETMRRILAAAATAFGAAFVLAMRRLR